MPSKSESPDQPEPQPADLFSSYETRAMLEEFRELVRAGILRVTPENEVLSGEEPPSVPATEKPAGSREGDVALLDKQLLEWLERRKQQKAELSRQEEQARREDEAAPSERASESLFANLRQKVVDLVARKILESWERAEQGPDPLHSLRGQVVDRAAEHLLRRLKSDPE